MVTPTRRHVRPLARGGWTMVEVMVSALLVGVLIVPVTAVFIRTANNYYREGVRDRAWQLGEELMAEIMTRDWEDPVATGRIFGLEPDESPADRLQWDDIDDYHGFVDMPPSDESGTPLPDCSEYVRQVTVEYLPVDGSADKIRLASDAINTSSLPLSTSQDSQTTSPFKVITVTVQGPVGPPIRITALRYEQGAWEPLPLLQSQSIERVQMDASGPIENIRARASQDLLNRFPGTGGR